MCNREDSDLQGNLWNQQLSLIKTVPHFDKLSEKHDINNYDLYLNIIIYKCNIIVNMYNCGPLIVSQICSALRYVGTLLMDRILKNVRTMFSFMAMDRTLSALKRHMSILRFLLLQLK